MAVAPSYATARGRKRRLTLAEFFVSDTGLVHLMGKLRVDGLRIQQNIECTSIGRVLGDFPTLVEEHNDHVKALEETLVKYLKNGQPKGKRPMITQGGFMGMGGHTEVSSFCVICFAPSHMLMSAIHSPCPSLVLYLRTPSNSTARKSKSLETRLI